MWKSEGSKISKTGPHGLQMLLVLDVMWYFFGTLFYFPLYGKRDTPIFELDSELKIKDEWKGFKEIKIQFVTRCPVKMKLSKVRIFLRIFTFFRTKQSINENYKNPYLWFWPTNCQNGIWEGSHIYSNGTDQIIFFRKKYTF